MNHKNFQEYFIDRIIDYLEESKRKDEQLRPKHTNMIIENCFHCYADIYIDPRDYHDIYVENNFRRCSRFYDSTSCKFIICNDCENNHNYYPWLAISTRHVDDFSYVCNCCPRD
jgi:hypothetical protein